ncbi:polyketide cyclase/dehydrase and lipid transport superfamily protein [Actinidia rufa]|uniref:Polyketide cyclase/dehydrase and lipid transport superfamily protein n=1 Tax=Actinidia rufa TaxID=165716 RepID=A0A7J0DX23_9ERIC|nr:polyketide cyclase/dehydrase and lipid transport superfamily protein [Actinidia rufa]
MFMAPLWIAVFVGVMVGWAWKPKWANLSPDLVDCSSSKASSSTSPSASSGLVPLLSIPSLNSMKLQLPSCISWISYNGFEKESSSLSSVSSFDCSSSQQEKAKSVVVAEDDLEHLCRLVEEKDEWASTIYRSSTIFEDVTPEMMREFFWDDEFRLKWDDMLVNAEILEECPSTGTMVVRWVRKFPFFCSDREYIIGRRIWESGRLYYCVTKGVPCPSVPPRNKPRRVDSYYSSWCIRAVESKKGGGQLSACEVLLFHHEEMGIPWEIAKLGVRQGMWGAVKKIDRGLCAYRRERESSAPLSQCALMAQINTKVSADYLATLESTNISSSDIETADSSEKPSKRNIPKVLIVGGAIALACSLDRGLLTKAVIFGVARRFAKIGKRL